MKALSVQNLEGKLKSFQHGLYIFYTKVVDERKTPTNFVVTCQGHRRPPI